MKKLFSLIFMSISIIYLVSCAKENEPQAPVETGTAVKGDKGYTYTITVDKIQFSWLLSGKIIHVKLRAETSGWVAVGFNPTDRMKDANFIMGFVKDGKVEVSNQHGISPNLHRNNTELGGRNFISNPTGVLKDNMTEVTFEYPLSTGDMLDRPITADGDTGVLLAYGSTALLAQKHAFRARLAVNLSNGKYTLFNKANK